jgi:hypothetical protein
LRYEDRTYLRDRREDGIYFRSVRYRKMVAELEERLREVGLRA